MTQMDQRRALRKFLMDQMISCTKKEQFVDYELMSSCAATLQALAIDQIASSGDFSDISAALKGFTKEFGGTMTHLVAQLRYVGASA